MAIFKVEKSSDKFNATGCLVKSHEDIGKTKYGLHKLLIGQSLFCPYDHPQDPAPYDVRLSAKALNRRHGMEIFGFYKHKEPKVLEIARIN